MFSILVLYLLDL